MRSSPSPGRIGLAVLLSLATAPAAEAQTEAGAPRPVEVSGAANINSKGISLVPALTLGRPSAIFDLAVRKGGLGFEPQLRFALDGKPWSFLLWWRYRAVSRDRFHVTVGGHPAYSFRSTTQTAAGAAREVIEVRRYLAAEVTPTYTLSPRVAAGGYYLYSHGVDAGAPPHTHFAAARVHLTNITIAEHYVLQAAPQVYFLRTAGQNGTYVSASATFGRRGSPWAIGTIVNQPIRSDVAGGRRFLWNAGVTHTFRVR